MSFSTKSVCRFLFCYVLVCGVLRANLKTWKCLPSSFEISHFLFKKLVLFQRILTNIFLMSQQTDTEFQKKASKCGIYVTKKYGLATTTNDIIGRAVVSGMSCQKRYQVTNDSVKTKKGVWQSSKAPFTRERNGPERNGPERNGTELFKGCSHSNGSIWSVNIFLPRDINFLSSPLSFSIFMRKQSYCLES